MRSFFLPNWSPPDDPARPLPAEGRPWPSDDDDDHDDNDNDKENDYKDYTRQHTIIQWHHGDTVSIQRKSSQI